MRIRLRVKRTILQCAAAVKSRVKNSVCNRRACSASELRLDSERYESERVVICLAKWSFVS